MLGGLAGGLTMPALSGCGGDRRQSAYSAYAASAYSSQPPPPTLHPSALGLDAVIDISHTVDVSDLALVRRRSNILGIIHKASEGGDWIDPQYSLRRPQAEAAGLLWGAYHFGTRQYSGADQAAAFLAAVRPSPSTLMALDYEPNDANPRNTMELAQAEAFVVAIHQATGRLPMVYVHPKWANGLSVAGMVPDQPIMPGSILARCELWLADYREQPEVPMAWADRGWRLWQYAANETEADAAYGTVPRAVAGVSHCDRNVFAGDTSSLYRFWNSGGRAT